VFPLSYTLDHCGPLSWTVEAAALTMQVIAGHDPLDPASADIPTPDFTSDLKRDLAGLKLAYPRAFFAAQDDISPEVVASLDAAVQQVAKLGAKDDVVTLPDFELFNACGASSSRGAYAIHEQDLLTALSTAPASPISA
jgi:aspartyl-tRNA(Asn)/glutamyl-tRNA(Gln) amidotransferase subunit A